ncbi:MAG: SDR family NAD(P)-dependent oxidoreductase [Methanomicrobiaceae archaeon]|nr:SDR family NAD(P)-dependent oxidoreductase [Methanomicrobiaceae archaeon]
MDDYYKGKVILITGAAGSIGSSLIDELLKYEPAVIRCFENNENGLFQLREKYSNGNIEKIRFLMGDIRDLGRMEYAFRGVDIVFHTASYKHVLECEYNPLDAINTNIIGTANVIQAAISQNVKKVIFTSSDKAANPSNTMGTTKLMAEKLMIAANDYGARSTVFACCRFGNVIGTSGSVIPLFKKQILEGKKITITDPKMTRFMITQDSAINLVLKTGIMAEGGEIYIFKMPSVNINDLSEILIEIYGQTEKEIIGKKPGEKMYEEIMTEEEMSRAYENDEMYIIYPYLHTLNYKKMSIYKKVEEIKNSSEMEFLGRDEIKSLLNEAGI